jgi:hypothetical protein
MRGDTPLHECGALGLRPPGPPVVGCRSLGHRRQQEAPDPASGAEATEEGKKRRSRGRRNRNREEEEERKRLSKSFQLFFLFSFSFFLVFSSGVCQDAQGKEIIDLLLDAGKEIVVDGQKMSSGDFIFSF